MSDSPWLERKAWRDNQIRYYLENYAEERAHKRYLSSFQRSW